MFFLHIEVVINLRKAFWVLIVLAMAGGVGVLIGMLVSRQGDVEPVAVPAGSNPPVMAIAPAIISDSRPTFARTGRARSSVSPVASTQPAGTAPEEFPEWEKQLDDVLLADSDANTKADRILAMIPTAPTNAQIELAQHLVNMTQDDHYDGTAQLLTNAATPEGVSTVLMNDLLNRNNSLKLPMLLAVARDDDHPLKDQAREMLELLLQEDNGSNWDQWSSSITTWLQNNP